jgi:azurin
MQGDFLICNVIGFLGIKHYDLARNAEQGTVWGEPAGAELSVKVTQADGSVTEDKSRGLLMSGDKNFRPSDAVFGEDGALYIADWHNVIIGHMQHNVRDPNRDHKHGRIYRMTAKGRPLQAPVAIDGQPIPALLENLKHPTDSVRHRTRVELSERPTAEVIAATKEWMKTFDPKNKEHAHHLLEALWVHQQHNIRDTALLASLQQSPDLHVRNAANVVQHLWFNVEASMKGGVLAGEVEAKAEKSGVLSDKPELTTIRVGTIRERLMYDVKELNVKVGRKIRLTFANTDVMPHNLLVTKPGKADAVMNAAVAMGAAGFGNGFIPAGGDILHHTKLLDGGKSEVLEFTLNAPGDYPFVCSFPGHGILMRGVLKAR